MIRDPSDGTVREKPKAEVGIPTSTGKSPAIDTGLRQPTRTDAQERLEFSREWLKAYHAKKDDAHARGNSSGTEHQADGRAGNEAGQDQS